MLLILIACVGLVRPDLILNEVLFAPFSGDSEFVEVYNRSTRTVSLNGWAMFDERRLARPLPTSVSIPSGGWAVFVSDGEAFARAFPGVPYAQVPLWPALNNDADRVGIVDPSGCSDEVEYAASWASVGRSIERTDPDGPSDHRVNWVASIDAAGATPGRLNSVYSPDRTPPRLLMADWLESTHLRVEFDEPVHFVNPTQASIAASRAIESILSADGLTAELWFTQRHDEAVLRLESIRDLFGNIASVQSAPVARPVLEGDLVVSEVLFDPLQDPYDGQPDQPAFIEVLNTSSAWLSFRGIELAAARRDDGLEKRAPVTLLPKPIAPGGRAVLLASTAEPPSQALSAAFGSDDLIVAMNASPWPFGRSDSRVRVVSDEQGDVAFASVSASWHDPARSPTRGRSLERIDPWSDRNGPAAWSTSTHPTGASPGAAAATENATIGTPLSPGDAVINEILYAPTGSQVEFVEIRSVSERAIDLQGSWLQIGSDSVRLGYQPTRWPSHALAVAAIGRPDPESALVGPFAGPIDWPLPAITSATLGNAGAFVGLRSADGLWVDSVRYAPTWHHPGLADTRGRSLERIDPWGASNAPSNWTSALGTTGASPGLPNRVETGTRPLRPVNRLSIDPHVMDPGAGVFARITSPEVESVGLLTLRIYDLAGRIVRTLAAETAMHQAESVYWDGLDDTRRPAAPGVYVVYARVVSADGKTVADRRTLVLSGQ